MRKLTLFVCAVLMVCGATPAFSYVIDGNLNDWGVTPFVDWTPKNPNVNWRVADNTNQYPDGGLGVRVSRFSESRDLEAMYADNDDDYIYWAMVSSVPFDPAYSRTNPRPEDLAIDVDGDGVHEYGLKVGLLGARQDNGAPIQSDVYNVSNWYSQDGADYKIKNGTVIGNYEIFNRYLGEIEPWPGPGDEPKDANNSWGWTARTYVLEARVSRLLFGGLNSGDVIRLFFAKYECITDYIWVDLSINDGGTPPTNGGDDVIPEPGTMLLLGGGVVGLFARRFKKKA